MRILYFIIGVVFFTACADTEEKGETYVSVNGVAIDGYDPVAYFEAGEAQKGSIDIVSSYQGIQYQFSSEINKTAFEGNPESFIPAYGGWCAYAVAENSVKMESNPTMWKIQDGQLLLFYDDWMTSLTGSLLEEWNSSPKDYEVKANTNWDVMTP